MKERVITLGPMMIRRWEADQKEKKIEEIEMDLKEMKEGFPQKEVAVEAIAQVIEKSAKKLVTAEVDHKVL